MLVEISSAADRPSGGKDPIIASRDLQVKSRVSDAKALKHARLGARSVQLNPSPNPSGYPAAFLLFLYFIVDSFVAHNAWL